LQSAKVTLEGETVATDELVEASETTSLLFDPVKLQPFLPSSFVAM
jgi:hypothetical protein